MTGLPWLAFLALGSAFAITALPSGAALRAGELADSGRLRARAPVASHALRLPWSRLGLIVAGLVVAGVLAWRGAALAVAAAAVSGTAGLLVRDARGRRAEARNRRDLLTAVGLIGAELSAGAPPAAALDAAAGAGPAVVAVFGQAAGTARAGGDAAAVLCASSTPGIRAVGLAWRLGETTGAALNTVIERVAADLAGQDEQRRVVATVLAGPRSSALLLSGLPLIGLGLGVAMGAAPFAFLVGDPIGRAVCCAGVLLDVAGVLWIRRIVGRVEAL